MAKNSVEPSHGLPHLLSDIGRHRDRTHVEGLPQLPAE